MNIKKGFFSYVHNWSFQKLLVVSFSLVVAVFYDFANYIEGTVKFNIVNFFKTKG